MVGMHLLQWMHSEAREVPALIFATRSGSRSSALAMATNEKPSESAACTVDELVDPAQQDEGHVERVAELPGVGKEEGLFEGVVRHESTAHDPEPEAQGPGQGGGELLAGGLAPEQVHGVGQGAAAGEGERVESSVGLEQPGHLDALFEPQPPRYPVGHVELGRHRHGVVDGVSDGADHLAGEAGSVLDASAPLVASVIELRAQERAQEVVVAEVDLDAVEPGVDDLARGASVVGGDPGDVGFGDLAAHGPEGADVS